MPLISPQKLLSTFLGPPVGLVVSLEPRRAAPEGWALCPATTVSCDPREALPTHDLYLQAMSAAGRRWAPLRSEEATAQDVGARAKYTQLSPPTRRLFWSQALKQVGCILISDS